MYASRSRTVFSRRDGRSKLTRRAHAAAHAPHVHMQPLHLQSSQRPWPLASQAKGSQPLLRGGAVGLEIAISSRRADGIGDDVSGSPNILQTPAHPG